MVVGAPDIDPAELNGLLTTAIELDFDELEPHKLFDFTVIAPELELALKVIVRVFKPETIDQPLGYVHVYEEAFNTGSTEYVKLELPEQIVLSPIIETGVAGIEFTVFTVKERVVILPQDCEGVTVIFPPAFPFGFTVIDFEVELPDQP
jgi:hypothetical protein